MTHQVSARLLVILTILVSALWPIEVTSNAKNLTAHRCEAVVHAHRSNIQDDRKKIANEKLSAGDKLVLNGTSESLRAALEEFNEAYGLLQEISDRQTQAVALHKIGQVNYLLGSRRKALTYFNRALSLVREVKSITGEVAALNYIGRIYTDLGNRQQALVFLGQALTLIKDANDISGKAFTLNSLGRSYFLIGETQKAKEYLEQSLQLSHSIDDKLSEADALNVLGDVYDEYGEKQRALDAYNKALSIARAANNHFIEAQSLHNLGAIYKSFGELKKALDTYEQSLKLRRAIGDRFGEVETLAGIGSVYSRSNKYQQALDFYDQALSLAREVGDRAGEALVLNNIGAVYYALEDNQKALDYYNLSLPVWRAMHDLTGEAASLHNIAGVYYSMGEKQKALDLFKQALPLRKAVHDPSGVAVTLSNMGAVSRSLGDKQKAIEYYNEAQPLWRSVNDRQGEALTHNNIGRLYQELGESQKALAHFGKSLGLARATNDYYGEAEALLNIGVSFEKDGHLRQALDHYMRSIGVHESIRAATSVEEIKIGLAGQSSLVYQRAILLSLKLGQVVNAFNLTERARARTLLDQLGSIRIPVRKGMSVQQANQEQSLRGEMSELESKLREERTKPLTEINTPSARSFESQLDAKRRAYEDLLVRIKATSREYASLKSVDALPLSTVQKLIDKDTTLLSYYTTPEKIIAFVITRDSYKLVEIPVKQTVLKSSITWFRNFTSLRTVPLKNLNQLNDWLIKPLKQHIKTIKVGIIPHGVLHYLPFAALTNESHYFGEDHLLFYLPSASVLPFIQKKSKPVSDRILVLARSQSAGFSFLRYADEEANEVAELYNTKAITGEGATKTIFVSRAGNYSMLHIAAHAELNNRNPLFSRILFAPDKESNGVLEVREVYNLNLEKSSLVVLSACETQLGARSTGDDIVGLNRAFIYAGAPTIVAGLWTVDDEATGVFMKAFYVSLRQGMSKVESLRVAQRETRARYPHPYYWAGFVLNGDSR